VLALAEELSKGTIEKQLAKSDFELRLKALLRMANGEDSIKEKCFIKGESHATCSL
jgi:hypothetical protein